MKMALTLAATLIAFSQFIDSLVAAEPQLERVIHDVARAARRAKVETVLVLVREDTRSAKSVDAEQLLEIIQKQLTRMLDREQQVSGKIDQDAHEKATKTKARRNIRPSEAAAYLSETDTDAVLTADFREYRGRYSMRIALVDADRVLLNTTVSLDARPQEVPEEPAESKEKKDKPITRIDGNPVALVPPPGAKGSTGYVVRRPRPTGIARTRGGPGSRDIPVRGFGDRERKSAFGERREGASKEGEDREKRGDQEKRGDREKLREGEDGETGEGEEKSENKARRGQVPSSPLAKDIVRFASSMIGKQVGNGQCWTLAADALKAAGAEPPRGYTFGDEIPLEDMQPGDILQFKTTRIEEPGYWAVMGTPDHTAVVYSIGDRTFILHQNVGGKKYVQTFDIDFDNMTSGRVQVFRPRPARRR